MIRPEKMLPSSSVRDEIDVKYIRPHNWETNAALVAETKKQIHAPIFEVVGMDKIKNQQRFIKNTYIHVNVSTMY